MGEEQKEILRMLQEGKITAEEAERLLKALEHGLMRREKIIATRGAMRRSLGSSLESISEAMAGIGPIIAEAVSEATSGLTSVGNGLQDYDDEELEPLELEKDGKFEIVEGRHLVIRNDRREGHGGGNLVLEGGKGGKCQILGDLAERVRVFRGPDFDLIKWSEDTLHVKVPKTVAKVIAATLGGDVTTNNLPCEVSVKTLGGDMEMGDLCREFSAKTMGGNIQMSIVASPDGPSKASTMGGDITVKVCSGCDMKLKATTMGGEIDVDPELGEVVQSPHFGRQKATVLIGGESASPEVVKLKTMGGNILIVKAETGGESCDEDE